MAAGGALAAAATGRRSTTTRITGLLLANVARNLQFACARHLIHIKRTERKTNCSSRPICRCHLQSGVIKSRRSCCFECITFERCCCCCWAACECAFRRPSRRLPACLQKQPCSQKIKLFLVSPVSISDCGEPCPSKNSTFYFSIKRSSHQMCNLRMKSVISSSSCYRNRKSIENNKGGAAHFVYFAKYHKNKIEAYSLHDCLCSFT